MGKRALELTVDLPGGCAVPMFDAVKGSTLIVATPRGMRRIKCKSSRFLITPRPITHQMLKAVGDAADAALKERVYFSALVLTNKREIGFAAFTDKIR